MKADEKQVNVALPDIGESSDHADYAMRLKFIEDQLLLKETFVAAVRGLFALYSRLSVHACHVQVRVACARVSWTGIMGSPVWRVLIEQYYHGGRWWIRASAQVWNDVSIPVAQ
jgi:hypothetical protein